MRLVTESSQTLLRENIKGLIKWRDTPYSRIVKLNIVQMLVLLKMIYSNFNKNPGTSIEIDK